MSNRTPYRTRCHSRARPIEGATTFSPQQVRFPTEFASENAGIPSSSALIRDIRGASPIPGHRLLKAALIGLMLALMIGCAQEMDDQPRLDPQEAAPFFADGIASRPLPAHTLLADPATWQVRQHSADILASDDPVERTGRENEKPLASLPASLLERTSVADLLRRGQERYRVSCVPCHDASGSGNGMVARRGFPYPPTFHSDRLRSQPLGYFFVVATEGHKKMPPYGDLISTEDRWAIAAYVRALQFSQHADIDQLEAVDVNALKESP